MVKKHIVFWLCFIIFVSSVTVPAYAYTPSSFEISAEGCVLANIDTDTVIYEKNSNNRLYPASLTKIMTSLVVLDECSDLQNTTVTASAEALNLLLGTDSSTFGLVEGEQFSVLNLLYIMMVHSSNDAANVLAGYFGGGSIDSFVQKMNQKAKDLGMNNTHFENPHGLHSTNHYTTAWDMYLLSKYALKNNTFKEIVGTVRYTVPASNKGKKRVLATTNFLQDPNSTEPSYYYKYASGVKTGYTDEAGRCLISTAKKKESGTTYLCVLMKCPVTDASGRRVRREFTDSKNLYEWAFNTFEYRQIYDTKTPVGECKVELSKDSDHVALVLKDNINAVLPKDADNSTVQVEISLYNDTVTAPVKAGQSLGTATVKYAGEEIGSSEVVAMSSAEKSDLLSIIKFFKDVFNSGITRLVLILAVLLVAALVIIRSLVSRRRRRKKYRRNRYHY